VDTLLLADEGDNGFDVFGGQPFDRWHVTERPMMGSGAGLNREEEGSVAVVAWFVHLGEV
jgi:hypothetical protein